MKADRALEVPPGWIVRTGYVPIARVTMDCRERMAVGDLDRAYQKALQLGDRASFPPPWGEWGATVFHLKDGRHEYIARLMLGHSHLFVAWLEDPTNAKSPSD